MAAVHKAKDIVQEALDTIRATYWVAGAEFKYALVSEWGNLTKAIEVKTTADDGQLGRWHRQDDKAKIVGVCSIGALALANMTLYDEHLAPWDTISSRDKQSWLAGAAVAMTALELFGTVEGEYFEPFEGSDPANIIVGWNDNSQRTRDDVVKVFKKALSHPMVTAKNAWAIQVDNADTALVFPTKVAAQAFLASRTKLRKKLDDWAENYYGSDVTYSIGKVDLPS